MEKIKQCESVSTKAGSRPKPKIPLVPQKLKGS